MSDVCHKYYTQRTKKTELYTGTVFSLFSLADFCLLHKTTTEVTASKCSLPKVFRFVVKQGYRDRASNVTQHD